MQSGTKEVIYIDQPKYIMSEDQQNAAVLRIIDECKTAKERAVKLRAEARRIGTALQNIEANLAHYRPSREQISKFNAELPTGFISIESTLALADDIQTTSDRITFLDNELRGLGIQLVPESNS